MTLQPPPDGGDITGRPGSGVHIGRTGVGNERRIAAVRAGDAGRGAASRIGATGLRSLFAPRGIAVIGASATPDKLGAAAAAAAPVRARFWRA